MVFRWWADSGPFLCAYWVLFIAIYLVPFGFKGLAAASPVVSRHTCTCKLIISQSLVKNLVKNLPFAAYKDCESLLKN